MSQRYIWEPFQIAAASVMCNGANAEALDMWLY